MLRIAPAKCRSQSVQAKRVLDVCIMIESVSLRPALEIISSNILPKVKLWSSCVFYCVLIQEWSLGLQYKGVTPQSESFADSAQWSLQF